MHRASLRNNKTCSVITWRIFILRRVLETQRKGAWTEVFNVRWRLNWTSVQVHKRVLNCGAQFWCRPAAASWDRYAHLCVNEKYGPRLQSWYLTMHMYTDSILRCARGECRRLKDGRRVMVMQERASGPPLGGWYLNLPFSNFAPSTRYPKSTPVRPEILCKRRLGCISLPR